jgi:hypothetical protein
MRTICVGDIHGCLVETLELLKVINHDPASDHLVFLGDLIDRGPHPKEVVELVRSLPGKVTTIQGNHDQKCCDWMARQAKTGKGRSPDAQRLAEWQLLGEDNLGWLASLPVLVEPLPGWFAVHAGFENRAYWLQSPDKLMRVRYVHPVTGLMMPFVDGKLEQPSGTVLWSEAWEGIQNVVYGHAVLSLTEPYVNISPGGAECWGIDTGCVFGGRLTALCLETKEFFR